VNVPRTIWLAWCHTCGMWLDETEGADYSARLVLDEHPDHLMHEEGVKRCRVEVIPFRVDRKAALRVVARRAVGRASPRDSITDAVRKGTAEVVLVRPRKRTTKKKGR